MYELEIWRINVGRTGFLKARIALPQDQQVIRYGDAIGFPERQGRGPAGVEEVGRFFHKISIPLICMKLNHVVVGRVECRVCGLAREGDYEEKLSLFMSSRVWWGESSTRLRARKRRRL